MNMKVTEELRDVVRRRLDDIGLNAFEAARTGGLERQFIYDLVAGRKKAVKTENLMKLAKALDWSVEQLTMAISGDYDHKNDAVAVKRVPVVGQIAASTWIKPKEFPNMEQAPVAVISGLFDGLEQFAYRVTDSSVDIERIFEGDYVICVRYFDARVAFTDGDIVVVKKWRGDVVEVTCKKLILTKDGIDLIQRSTDPEFTQTVHVKAGANVADDGEPLEIAGLVIGTFTPRVARPR